VKRRAAVQHRRATAIVAGWALVLTAVATVLAPTVQAANIRQSEWYLDVMQAPKMWQVSTGKGITVAVIDSGVDASAPELQGQVLPGHDFVTGSGDGQQDPDGHGTAISMIIAGSGNAGGVMGLAPDAKVLPLRVGVSSGAAGEVAVQEFSEAIRFAVDHQAKVINISAGFPEVVPDPHLLTPLEAAVQYAENRGSLIFAATGNRGSEGNYREYPAAASGVAGIAAVDETGTWLKFSTHGPQVALAAPGKDITARCSKEHGYDGGYCTGDGTSQATAIASASAALIWAKHPDWTGNQVLRVLLNTASKPASGPVPNEFVGYGVVRPRIALLGDPGDLGPPNVNPLLAAKTAQSASASAAQPSPSAARGSGNGNPSAESQETLYWVGIGIGVVLVVGGAVASLVVYRRRRASSYGRG